MHRSRRRVAPKISDAISSRRYHRRTTAFAAATSRDDLERRRRVPVPSSAVTLPRQIEERGIGAPCSRRRALALVSALPALLVARKARAEDVAVPPRLQAELLARVAGYDRNLARRAGDLARVLLVIKPGDDESVRVVAQMKTALGELERIGDLPHDEEVVSFGDAAGIASACRARRAAVVFFGPGFDRDLAQLRSALDGVDVLSVSAVADYVPRGIVLGFDLVSGRPKLLVNLTQARRQGIAFRADLLKIMRVYE
jgi:hypothetical protein